MFTRYWFWLLIVSLSMVLLERIRPWRKGQPFLSRPHLAQDVFWLVFNGVLWGELTRRASGFLAAGSGYNVERVTSRLESSLAFLANKPLWLQVIVYLVIADFIEWCAHNLLHRVGWMWRIHRIHHSIKIMDWIGNFRFHWGEIVIYKTVKYLPLVLLGANWQAVLIAAVIATTMGHLNHANLPISWGPLRFVFNSPRMHIWHHDKYTDRPAGYNFAVVFSLWDWLFGTAYMPLGRIPRELGFHKEERLPPRLLVRFLNPFATSRAADKPVPVKSS